jgi:hypothetical protein
VRNALIGSRTLFDPFKVTKMFAPECNLKYFNNLGSIFAPGYVGIEEEDLTRRQSCKTAKPRLLNL